MNRQEIVQIIDREKVVAIIRMKQQSEVPPILQSLVKGGITVLEITSNTPGYLEEISAARNAFPEALIGAGTVFNTTIAQDAIKAGAQFLVTPNTNPEIVELAHKNNIPVLMGALTPSEVADALNFGADIIKLFPANNFGTKYLKAVKGPFNQAKIYAVGGVGFDNLQEWIDAGASGVGIGSVVIKPVKEEADLDKIEQLAKQFIEVVKKSNWAN